MEILFCRVCVNLPKCTFFSKIQVICYDYLARYFPDFLRSEFHCKYQVDILTSGRVYLADILYNESATSYFMEVSPIFVSMMLSITYWSVVHAAKLRYVLSTLKLSLITGFME